jgi:Uma2 family endonuclease
MAIVPSEREARVVLRGVSWSTYEALLADVDAPGSRITYDRGDLEIMSPFDEHERFKRLIGRLIETLTEESEIPIRSSGSTTFRSEPKRRGLEPDESYYVANEPRVRGRDEIDLAVDPPPDLVVEVKITQSAIDRMPLCAALGVPEVWRYDGRSLQVVQLQPHGSTVGQALPDIGRVHGTARRQAQPDLLGCSPAPCPSGLPRWPGRRGPKRPWS